MNKFSMFLCFMVTIAAVGATIYHQICPDGINHGICNIGINFEENCPPGVTLEHFNNTEIKVLVKAHNEKRNYIASGNYTNLRPACRMVKINWRNNLAQAAASDIRKYKRDTGLLCDNTAAFGNAKQSIASWILCGRVNRTRALISAVESFYNEVENVNQTFIDSYPANYNGPKMNSFMRMMVDRNVGVGCAIGTFPITHHRCLYYSLLVCNYATSYLLGLPVYAKCDRAGQRCTKRSTNYFNLCAAHENEAVY